jgi:serine-threonine kinase receptor-associated protein
LDTITDQILIHRKIWDTFGGDVLHSFPHNHIVRTVALSTGGSHLLTGGQEKKVRIFDLARPDAEPTLLLGGGEGEGAAAAGAGTSHGGTVKSVVWLNQALGVSAGEDGIVK